MLEGALEEEDIKIGRRYKNAEIWKYQYATKPWGNGQGQGGREKGEEYGT